MVDVVVNDVMSTSITPDLSGYMFTEPVSSFPLRFSVVEPLYDRNNTTLSVGSIIAALLVKRSAGLVTRMFPSLTSTRKIQPSFLDSSPGSRTWFRSIILMDSGSTVSILNSNIHNRIPFLTT